MGPARYWHVGAVIKYVAPYAAKAVSVHTNPYPPGDSSL